MEAAYGLSITFTMLMTTILMISYLRLRKVSLITVLLFAVAYLSIEGAFLAANLTKFLHGGWFTVMAATVLSFIMFMMYGGRRVRNQFTTYTRFDKYLPILSEMSQDQTIPKFASQLVYTTHADNKTDIEEKTVYSLISRQPKRADVYWFLHVDVMDDPYTLEYKVTELREGYVFRIDFYLGFKVQPKINTYFKQVIKDLTEEGRFDPVSRHPSLRRYDIDTDFRFVQLDRRVNRHLDLPFFEKVSLWSYYYFRRIGISDIDAYELDSSLVTIEKIPLTIPLKSKFSTITKRK
jgi:KUP system potassium uptake protein